MNKELLSMAAIPSASLAIGATLPQLSPKYQNILKMIIDGLLFILGIIFTIIFFESTKIKDSKKSTFIVKCVIVILITKIISSLYLDIILDGLLLGSMFSGAPNLKNMLFIMILMSIKLDIKLREKKSISSKGETAPVLIIFTISIIIGSFIGNNLNQELVNGFGGILFLFRSGLYNNITMFETEDNTFFSNALYSSLNNWYLNY